MKLSVDQIREITQGAVSVVDFSGSVRFHRFTEEQEQLYTNRYEGCRRKYSTAGIKLCFKTDSSRLSLAIEAIESTSRTYFSVDVFANEKHVGAIDNFSNQDISGDYSAKKFPLGRFAKEFVLGDGIKDVTIYLPWSVELRIEELHLDENSLIEPICPDKILLAYGDSITHGYDAMRPMNRYAAQVAAALDAVEYNKAIGGEVFVPELVETKDDFEPDYIMVAYGTNDWGKLTWDEFAKNCKQFYQNLAKKHPQAKIFALAPVWRKAYMEVRECCDFSQIGAYIKEVTEPFSNIHVIDCFDFIPHDVNYFADFKIHPNDKGFEHYGKNLVSRIQQILSAE